MFLKSALRRVVILTVVLAFPLLSHGSVTARVGDSVSAPPPGEAPPVEVPKAWGRVVAMAANAAGNPIIAFEASDGTIHLVRAGTVTRVLVRK